MAPWTWCAISGHLPRSAGGLRLGDGDGEMCPGRVEPVHLDGAHRGVVRRAGSRHLARRDGDQMLDRWNFASARPNWTRSVRARSSGHCAPTRRPLPADRPSAAR